MTNPTPAPSPLALSQQRMRRIRNLVVAVLAVSGVVALPIATLGLGHAGWWMLLNVAVTTAILVQLVQRASRETALQSTLSPPPPPAPRDIFAGDWSVR